MTTHRVFYWSADGPGTDATWSVYSEHYVTPDAAEPIDGSTTLVSSHPSEAEAEAEARRLQAGGA